MGKPSLGLQCPTAEGQHEEVQEEPDRSVRKDSLLVILKNRDTALTALEEQELTERDAQGKVTRVELQPGKFLVKCLETGRRMSVCNAARYHVSVCVPSYIRYVQGYI